MMCLYDYIMIKYIFSSAMYEYFSLVFVVPVFIIRYYVPFFVQFAMLFILCVFYASILFVLLSVCCRGLRLRFC